MPPRKKTQGIIDAGEDTLAHELSEYLKKNNLFVYKIGEEDSPTDLKDFISSGSSLLDLAVSNKPNAGIITCGRIIELNGLEGSGKSLVCAHMIVNVQREGGIAVLFDTEFALNEEFFRAVGVDFTKLQVINTICLEDILDGIEKIIEKIRQANKNRKVLIIVDSMTAPKPRKELEGGFEKDGYGTHKAKLLSDSMSRITSLIAKQKVSLVVTQQLRMKLNVMAFADPYTTSGGKAIPFYSSVRIRFTLVGTIKAGPEDDKVIVGVKVKAKVIKNRLGPPLREATFDIYFDRGIDDISSWLDVLKKKDIIEGSKGNYTYVDSSGTEHKFRTGTWKKFTEENPTVFEEIYNKLAEAMIMNYRSEGLSTVDGTAEVSDVIDLGD